MDPVTDEPMTVGAACCGERAPGRPGEPPVIACMLCPNSPTYWQNEPGAAARLKAAAEERLRAG
jgi:hypothetical protein